MYFDLTDDQKAIVEAVDAVLVDHLPADKMVAVFDAGALDRGLWTDLAAMGALGLLVSEEDGGLGMDLLTLAAVQERLGWHAAPVPLMENTLAAWLLATAGSPAQRDAWLSRISTGEAVVAFAFSANPGKAATGGSLDATLDKVAFGVEADLLIVGGAGDELLLVDAKAGHVTATPLDTTDRTRPLATLTFAGAEAEPLGAAGDLAVLLDAIYVLLAADACGAGHHALTLAVDYAQTRHQFGRPIGSFQGLKHQLADLAVEMEPARYLMWFAAHAWDAIPEKRSYAASQAKAHLGETAVRVARGAVEAHGGIGYTWEYPLHIYLKRAMGDRAAFGSPAVHRARTAQLSGW